MNGKQVATGQGLGLSAGQIFVWLLEAYVFADPVPAEIAIAFGTVIAGVIHYLQARISRNEKDILQ